MADTSGSWQRARSPEQKQERARAILEAAGRLLDAHGLDGTGLNAIAREAGLSKPNLYVYFESREAIVLELLLGETESWVRVFVRRLDKLEVGDLDGVAAALASTLASRRRLCAMSHSVSTVLENNVDTETIAGFKRSIMPHYERATAALARVLGVPMESALRAMGMLFMASIGIWGHLTLGDAAAEVLARPEFAMLKHDFTTTVREHARAFLAGWIEQQ